MLSLQAELRFAQTFLGASTADEEERLDLLNGVAAQIERDLAGGIFGKADGSGACIRLLAHLAGARPVAIRSEKLSSFPCSQSAPRISACH